MCLRILWIACAVCFVSAVSHPEKLAILKLHQVFFLYIYIIYLTSKMVHLRNILYSSTVTKSCSAYGKMCSYDLSF